MAVHPGYRENSFDCLLHSLMQRKRKLVSSALWPMGDADEDAAKLQADLGVAPSQGSSAGEPLRDALRALFERDGNILPSPATDGSVPYV
jgi:hypothetical protein